MPKIGVIFDWDGVVIDSSSMHERSWEMLAEEENLYLPENHFKLGFGRKNQYIIPNILHWSNSADEIARLGYRKEELYRELVRAEGLQPLPGVASLLKALKTAGVPCAVGSSTPRINLDAVMDMLGFTGYFQAIVSAEDVGAGKPDPEVFLKAAAKIATPPQQCIVFEDALYGIEAGKRGGMKVIAVATTHPLHELHSADQAVQSLEEITVDRLVELVGSR